MIAFKIARFEFALWTAIACLSVTPLRGATLLSDIRKIEVLAAVGTTEDHKVFEASFGESSFARSASASASGRVGSDIGGTSASASIETQLVLDAAGFHSVVGKGAVRTEKHPDYFGGAIARSIVDETFHLDVEHTYELSGFHQYPPTSVIRLEHVGGPAVFTAPPDYFYSTGVLTPGDYRFLANLAPSSSWGTGEGNNQFNFRLFAHQTPPPNSYVGDITTTALANLQGSVLGFEVTIGKASQDPSGPPTAPLIFENLFLTPEDSGRTFTKVAGDSGFDEFVALLTNDEPDTLRMSLGGRSWTEQSLFTSSTGVPFPFMTDFHGQQIQSISLVVNSVVLGPYPGFLSGTLNAYLAVQVVPEPSTSVYAWMFVGLGVIVAAIRWPSVRDFGNGGSARHKS